MKTDKGRYFSLIHSASATPVISVKQIVFCFILCLLVYLSGFSQNASLDKIDPAFRDIIKTKSGGGCNTSKKAASNKRIEPTVGYSAGDSVPTKRYDCIVYTKNANALRSKGIKINSELSSFVTAWVTPEQILQMAAMPEVTYIEAPQKNSPENQPK